MKEYDFSQLVNQWDQLDSAGIPLEPPEYRIGVEDCPHGRAVTIRQEGFLGDSIIRELKNGRFAYVANLLIRRNHPGKTIIRATYLTPPWVDTDIELVPDPEHVGQDGAWYSFPGDADRFYRDQVLNHRIRCTLARGDIREGLILAVSPVRPPDKYRNNDKIRLTFTIVDQWDLEHSASLRLRLQRLPAQVKEIGKRKRGSLLDHPDKIGG